MSAKFETVQMYYNRGVWNKDRVRNAVLKKWITEEEYKIITGEEYAV